MLDVIKSCLYNNRFELFLMTQLAVLFGSLFFPEGLFEYTIQPFFFIISIAAGINLIASDKVLMWLFILLFLMSAILFGTDMLSRSANTDTMVFRVAIYFLFSIAITNSLIKQVWKASFVDRNVIMGLISGYISLGFISFFLFMFIELTIPGAFRGVLLEDSSLTLRADSIMYYAFITLLTIGYGEIVPMIPMAQKAAIFTGLSGQFYLIIVMTVVLEKYINHSVRR